jgi:hypothetical protein
MYSVNQITSDPKQSQQLYLPDGSAISLSLEYKSQQYGWFMSISYGDNFTVTGLRVVTSPNLLQQFKNILPFGMAVTMKGNLEPTNIQDFSSGNAKMYILTSGEVDQFEAYLNG